MAIKEGFARVCENSSVADDEIVSKLGVGDKDEAIEISMLVSIHYDHLFFDGQMFILILLLRMI